MTTPSGFQFNLAWMASMNWGLENDAIDHCLQLVKFARDEHPERNFLQPFACTG